MNGPWRLFGPAARGWSDRYLVFLGGMLVGYAILGKGFAYLGVPPLYIGEVAFGTGLLVLLSNGRLLGLATTGPGILLTVAIFWVVSRTVPYIRPYGFDALRDSVVIVYGVFAFVLISLLLEDCARVPIIIRWYGRLLNLFGSAIPFTFLSSWYLSDYLPKWPGGTIPLFEVRPGEAAVHLTGVAVFGVVGLRKIKLTVAAPLIGGLVMVGALSRGPMLAELIPIAAATIAIGKFRQFSLAVVISLGLFGAAYVIEPFFFQYVPAESSDERSISTRQVIDNVLSTVGQSGDHSESTKEWRLRWWDIIVEDTTHGPNFWTGRGFGRNIAEEDGFGRHVSPSGSPPLRSPHDVHATMLARAGVPGLLLWLGFVISWFWMIGRAAMDARRLRQRDWLAVFVFVACYVMSILINASFDVALEGPMLGIWFWCLIGFGIGSVMVFRAPRSVSQYPPPLATTSPLEPQLSHVSRA